MKEEYIDVVSEELFKNNNFLEIEDAFLSCSITIVYVVREVNNKEDVKDFELPKSEKINYKKAYLLKDLNVNVAQDVVFGYGGDVNNISKVLESKKIKYLFNPFSENLAFDEASANLAKQNNKRIIINLDDYRKQKSKAIKTIKQSFFVYEVCMDKRVDFLFCSYARKIEEVVDPLITINFLKEFKVPETLSKRVLKEKL